VSENNLHISDAAFEQIHAHLVKTLGGEPVDIQCSEALEECLANATAFYHLFSRTPFIFEPVHDFEAMIHRKGSENTILSLRMVLNGDRMYIRSPEECPVDDGYFVRKVIAESHFEEFQPHDDQSQNPPA